MARVSAGSRKQVWAHQVPVRYHCKRSDPLRKGSCCNCWHKEHHQRNGWICSRLPTGRGWHKNGVSPSWCPKNWVSWVSCANYWHWCHLWIEQNCELNGTIGVESVDWQRRSCGVALLRQLPNMLSYQCMFIVLLQDAFISFLWLTSVFGLCSGLVLNVLSFYVL